MAEETITIPNEIAQNLLAAETSSDPRYDTSARNLMAERPVLAYILKSALDEYKDCSVQEIAEKFIEGVPQIRKIAIYQDYPDNQSSVVEDVVEEEGSMAAGKISVTKEMSKEVLNVCNLSTGVYNKGYDSGVAQEEMIGKKEMALSLVSMGISVEKIAEAAKVSLETVQKWLSGNMSVAK